MEYLQIPLPDFSFEVIAKEKANTISMQLLHQHAIFQYGRGANPGLEDRLSLVLSKIIGKEERILCISELLNHVYEIKRGFDSNAVDEIELQKFHTGINHIQYHLYSIAKTTSDYTFDKNGFSDEEITNVKSKIDSILEALEKVQAGQEVIFDEFETIREQIKVDIKSLKLDLTLGKKKFSHIALGTICKYAGNKTADIIFDQIKPTLIAFFTAEAPHLIEGFENFIRRINI